MFRINIITLGTNKNAWVDDAVAHYLKLLKKYASVRIDYIPDIKKSKNLSKSELTDQEEKLIEKYLKSNYRIALSDKGKKYRSEQFARFLSDIMQKSQGSVDFVIGGVYGLSKDFLTDSRSILSLSPMTMSHQLIRPVLLEQLYRGFSILSGTKYHK